MAWTIPAPMNYNGGNVDFGNPERMYKDQYQEAVNANMQNYTNIINGYRDTMAQQQAAQNRLREGYTGLNAGIMNTLSLADYARRQQIADEYAQQVGSQNQTLINRGLGNTTVQQATTRGLVLDRSKADTESTSQFNNLKAGYLQSVGLANLSAQNRFIEQNTALAQHQLEMMNSVRIPYPNAGDYMNAYGGGRGGGMVPNGGVPGSSGGVKAANQGRGGGVSPYYGGGGGGGSYGSWGPANSYDHLRGYAAPQTIYTSAYQGGTFGGYDDGGFTSPGDYYENNTAWNYDGGDEFGWNNDGGAWTDQDWYDAGW